MAATMDMTLVTPEATFFAGPAAMVEAPGTLGEFGVLPGHMNFILTLKPGVVRIHDESQKVIRIFVAGGIAEVNNTSCTILAERVMDLTSLSRAEAQEQFARAKAKADEAVEEEASLQAARDLMLAEAVLAALEGA
jgi:F-type H+-transporting ATPase subunit epsilon